MSNRKSDDPGRMRQCSGIAASNPRHSTTSTSNLASSLSSATPILCQPISTSPSFSSARNEYKPTDRDRIEILKSTKSKDGRFRLIKEDKKKLLKDLQDNRQNIMYDVSSIDKGDKNGLQRRLKEVFFKFENKNKRNKASVKELATWIVEIYNIFRTTLDLRLRASLRPISSFVPIVELMKKVDDQVKRDTFDLKGLEKNHRVKLSHAQMMKAWDSKLVPSDAESICPYCELKGTMNYVEGHEKVYEKNKMKMKEFEENTKQWELHKKNSTKNSAPIKKDGKAYTSVPIRPTYDTKIVRCCGDKFWCSNGREVDGIVRRVCPIQCKKEDGTPYEIIGDICSCPYCTSTCNFAHPFGLSSVIAANERALREGKMDVNSLVTKDKELLDTLQQIMNSSTKLATTNTNDAIKEMASKPENFKMNQSMVDYCDDVFHQNKALHAMTALGGVDGEKLFGLGKIVGSTTTCPVPAGKFDTRALNAAAKREHNNKLARIYENEINEENDEEKTPMMESNLKPSFNSFTHEYSAAAKKIPQPAPRALDYVKQAKTTEKGNNLQGNFDDEMEITKVVPPSGQTTSTQNVNASTKRKNTIANPAIYMVKRAKKSAIRLSHLTKVASELTDEQKREKAENIPTIKYYKEILLGGEGECEFIVETTADAVACSPASVSSEQVHSIVKNLL